MPLLVQMGPCRSVPPSPPAQTHGSSHTGNLEWHSTLEGPSTKHRELRHCS